VVDICILVCKCMHARFCTHVFAHARTHAHTHTVPPPSPPPNTHTGMSDEERLDCILRYDPRRKRWEDGEGGGGGAGQACARLPGGARFAVGAAVIRNTLLVAGGYNGRPLELVEALDLDKGVWIPAPDLTHARTDFAMATFMHAAVVGGGGTHTCELWDAEAPILKSPQCREFYIVSIPGH
jgi:hypothetical protein